MTRYTTRTVLPLSSSSLFFSLVTSCVYTHTHTHIPISDVGCHYCHHCCTQNESSRITRMQQYSRVE